MDKEEVRINELIAELSECREDERNTQNQILQVISVVGTILGILFTASYLNPENRDQTIKIFQNIGTGESDYIIKVYNIINNNITYTRIMFWLGLLIFCTAFCYIIVLGISNILRYYYIQNLEDRLYDLISDVKDNKDRGSFLHWNSYMAPIITQNVKHITSSHTALNYICYVVAVASAILFSMGIVISLFLAIKSRTRFDIELIKFVLLFMGFSFLLLLRLTYRARDVAQFAWDTAHENQKIRLHKLEGELYKKSSSFQHILKYLIYPKKQDPQKPFLIVIGFIYCVFWSGIDIQLTHIFKLIFCMFIFDFLAYQARYQINDIRGIDEDKEVGRNDRLLCKDIKNEAHVIKISYSVAFLKLLLAFLITVFYADTLRNALLVSLIILFISTIIYEIAKDRKWTWLVFFSVGMGYPLRFFVGFFPLVSIDKNILLCPQTICFILLLWSYGSLASILSWTNEVANQMQKYKDKENSFPKTYKKKHFQDIQEILISRFQIAQEHKIKEKVLPLREKCRLRDPWNMTLLLCFIFLNLVVFFEHIPKELLCLGCFIHIVFLLNICVQGWKKIILVGCSCLSVVGKVIWSIFLLGNCLTYCLISILELLIMITYFLLSYQPQFKKVKLKEVFNKCKIIIMVKILGESAVKLIEKEKQKKKK